MPAVTTANGIHWEVSQGTSLVNILIELSTEPGNTHQGSASQIIGSKTRLDLTLNVGLYMEDGSGGMMGGMICRCATREM